eukprot:TRINITY_DN3444_c0_g2_i4.p3 TRINITY_DN3444_c0_g2~~TRINITY_DN3444_c0_g2_i4.p3  ORF type:complete len:197 (+),score=-13.62 TRINITY_DN3444_c0_g2_i4:969-1559(+)
MQTSQYIVLAILTICQLLWEQVSIDQILKTIKNKHSSNNTNQEYLKITTTSIVTQRKIRDRKCQHFLASQFPVKKMRNSANQQFSTKLTIVYTYQYQTEKRFFFCNFRKEWTIYHNLDYFFTNSKIKQIFFMKMLIKNECYGILKHSQIFLQCEQFLAHLGMLQNVIEFDISQLFPLKKYKVYLNLSGKLCKFRLN